MYENISKIYLTGESALMAKSLAGFKVEKFYSLNDAFYSAINCVKR